jgi:hypothetical protein
VPVTRQASLLTYSFIKSLAEGNANVLYGMVSVNVEVAFSNNFQIDHAVTSNLIQHVLQEGHTGIELNLPRTIEAELYTDAGL